MTLPETVIASLGEVDRDLGRAIVRLAQPGLAQRKHPPAELVAFGRRAVIVVHPTRTLEQRTGVVLVPLSDGRALISFDASMTPARLELSIQDALEEKDLPEEDSRIFECIRELLREVRRSSTVRLRQQHIMVLEFSGPAGGRRQAAARSGTADSE